VCRAHCEPGTAHAGSAAGCRGATKACRGLANHPCGRAPHACEFLHLVCCRILCSDDAPDIVHQHFATRLAHTSLSRALWQHGTDGARCHEGVALCDTRHHRQRQAIQLQRHDQFLRLYRDLPDELGGWPQASLIPGTVGVPAQFCFLEKLFEFALFSKVWCQGWKI